jgi:hypothetical protein
MSTTPGARALRDEARKLRDIRPRPTIIRQNAARPVLLRPLRALRKEAARKLRVIGTARNVIRRDGQAS